MAIWRRQFICKYHPDYALKLTKFVGYVRLSMDLAKVWNQKLNDVFKRLRFKQADADQYLYVCKRSDSTVYILVYVDDMLIVTSNNDEYDGVIKALGNKFQITTLGDVKHFLGI